MLPRIQNILYATDLSDTARYAFGYAAALAQSLNADITVVYVIDELSECGKKPSSGLSRRGKMEGPP